MSSRKPSASILYALSAVLLAGYAKLVPPLGGVLVHDSGLEPLHVHDQRDIAVAQDRTAGNALDTFEILFQRLDHHLLLADDVVDDQRHLGRTLGLAQHDEAVVRI